MLERKYRVGREHFAEVMKGGIKISTLLFFVRYKRDTKAKNFKYAVVVSKKVARNAVDRNNFKRRVYSVVEQSLNSSKSLLGPHTAIFFIKSSLKKITPPNLKTEVDKVFSLIKP